MIRAAPCLAAILLVPSVRQDAAPKRPPPDIRADARSDWGCNPVDAEKVMRAAAGELWRFFPERRLPTILVEPKGGPIVLFRRGPGGEILVRLDVHGTYWAQLTYQFSHEFCHILCDYKDNPNPNKWFEETVCETASLFVLRRSAETWKIRPPYPHWKDYAPALRSYADERMEKARLPSGKSLADWYRENSEALSKNATDRLRNTVAATAILPLFEKTPEGWESVGFLNKGTFDATTTLRHYLEAWHADCPKKHRAFVRQLAAELGFAISAAP